jgi:hypothetical protein
MAQAGDCGGGGEATVFRAGAVEGATDKELVAEFRKAREPVETRPGEKLDQLIAPTTAEVR